MKTILITGALLFSVLSGNAQGSSRTSTVRIKEIKNINGVETIKDTTFTTSGIYNIDHPSVTSFSTIGNAINIRDLADKDSLEITEMVKRAGGKSDPVFLFIDSDTKVISLNEKNDTTEQITIVKQENASPKKKDHTVIVIHQVKITSPSEADVKKISDQTGPADAVLNVEKMDVYPNPTKSKLNLSFTLPDKGDTEVSILNDNGKKIYEESLNGFTGNYNKTLDINNTEKGVYFVRVEQGGRAIVKKIIVD